MSSLAANVLTLSNPITLLAGLSTKGWIGLLLTATVMYLRKASTLARADKDMPCPQFGVVFRVLYGLFGTWVAETLLGRMLLTPEAEPQAEQIGGTQETTVGRPELRIKMVPILGSAFGGNYAFLIWDENDPERRTIAVDPADPHPVLRAADADALKIELLLTTHWHFDHSAGNRTMAKKLPGLRVVASSQEHARTPAVNHRVADEAVLELGALRVRCHSVPGHTRGSMVYEVFSVNAPPGSPSAAFTGEAPCHLPSQARHPAVRRPAACTAAAPFTGRERCGHGTTGNTPLTGVNIHAVNTHTL